MMSIMEIRATDGSGGGGACEGLESDPEAASGAGPGSVVSGSLAAASISTASPSVGLMSASLLTTMQIVQRHCGVIMHII